MKPLINSELFFDLLSDSDESDNVLKNESTVQSETEEKLKVWESDSEPEEPVTKSWFELLSSASKSAKSKKTRPFGMDKDTKKNLTLKEVPSTGYFLLGQLLIQDSIQYLKHIIRDELRTLIVSESFSYTSLINISKPLHLTWPELN